jgi:hypothetical protein
MVIDSVDLHARAWQETFLRYGVKTDFRAVRDQIGKGGDKLMQVFLSEQQIESWGKNIEERTELFKRQYLPQVKPFPRLQDLFERLREVSALFKPTSFGGLFGAAPSVALATLALAVSKDGKAYAANECRSMVAGAAALVLYSILVSQLLSRHRLSALTATLSAMPLWFLTAFVLWRFFLT